MDEKGLKATIKAQAKASGAQVLVMETPRWMTQAVVAKVKRVVLLWPMLARVEG